MTTVLVTGGAGYIGSACCRQLVSQGCKVVIVDDLSTGHADAVHPDAPFHKVDIGDSEALADVLRANQIDVVFHFAAKALIPESVSNPGVFFDVNVARSVSMLEVLRRNGVRQFVFSSTAAVYGAPNLVPIPEDHVLVCGMAVGYADEDAAVNRLMPEKAPVEEFTAFLWD